MTTEGDDRGVPEKSGAPFRVATGASPRLSNSRASTAPTAAQANAGQNTGHGRALKAEVNRYCRDSRLTPRESDIVTILADGIVRIRDIADRLKLSPNTVNNHVNSIFVKTKTRSKSELLTILLNRIATELRWSRLMRASPSVTCVGGRSELSGELSQYQFRVRALKSAAVNELGDRDPEFLVYHLEDTATWSELFDEIRNVSRAQVIFTSEVVDDEMRAAIMHAGAVDVLERTVSGEQMALLILGHLIDEDSASRDFIETEHDAQLLTSPVPLKLAPGSWGTGGIFISDSDVRRLFGQELSRGGWIEFPVDCPNGQMILLRGRVVWLRKTPDQAAGVGIRILGRAQTWQRHFPQRLEFNLPPETSSPTPRAGLPSYPSLRCYIPSGPML